MDSYANAEGLRQEQEQKRQRRQQYHNHNNEHTQRKAERKAEKSEGTSQWFIYIDILINYSKYLITHSKFKKSFYIEQTNSCTCIKHQQQNIK